MSKMSEIDKMLLRFDYSNKIYTHMAKSKIWKSVHNKIEKKTILYAVYCIIDAIVDETILHGTWVRYSNSIVKKWKSISGVYPIAG